MPSAASSRFVDEASLVSVEQGKCPEGCRTAMEHNKWMKARRDIARTLEIGNWRRICMEIKLSEFVVEVFLVLSVNKAR